MKLFPAIDLYGGKAVRLFKGDYQQMTIYSDNPLQVALDFEKQGAKYIHLVDLEGAKDGTTPNINVVETIAKNTSLFVEIGGGIRSMQTIEKYLNIGVDRVILGTAAVNDQEFLKKAIAKYGDKIAVGLDVKEGFVAIKGWLEKSNYTCMDFCSLMQSYGVKSIICTDVSKDGAMQGANKQLYKQLVEKFDMEFTASGGVNSIEDLVELKNNGAHSAIIGKAYYVGAINLKNALEAVK